MATENWNFVKLINKVLQKWRNYGNSRVLPSILWRDESSSKIRTLFWNYQAEYRNCKNEVNCMNDSKDFQDAESVRSGNSHVTSRPVSFPPYPIPEGLLRPLFVSPSRKNRVPSIWDTHGISGNVFADPHASSSAPYPQELNQWNSSTEEPFHSSIVEKSEKPEQNLDRQPKIQSSSVEETLQRIMGQTNNDCRFWISTLTSSLHQQPLLAGR